MTAAEMAPPIRFDRYLALLAVLLAIVLGLLVMSERQRQPVDPLLVEGSLPPPPDPRLRTLTGERDALLAEQSRLAAALEERATALAASEAALRELEAEAGWLANEAERLDRLLGDEVAERQALARRLGEIAAERDRLAGEVRALTATRERLEARIAELTTARPPARPSSPTADRGASDVPGTAATAGTATPPPSTAGPTLEQSLLARPYEPRDPSATLAAQPSLSRAVDDLIDEQRAAAAAAASEQAESEAMAAMTDETTAQPTGRLITFNGTGSSVADGVAAYRDGDYATAARIWGALAAAGNARAQFHFGSLLFEGRLGEPDLVMAHVWLSRAVSSGHLPAIEMRRRVRAAMSEEEYERALAIEASS